MRYAIFYFFVGDDLNSESFYLSDHPSSNSNLNDHRSQASLRNWVKQKMSSGVAGKELSDMIAHEVDLQNKGPTGDLSSSYNKSRLTPEKMKLVAPAILSKILQSDALNRYVSFISTSIFLRLNMSII